MGYGLNYEVLMVGRCVVLGFALLMVGRSWSGFCQVYKGEGITGGGITGENNTNEI